MSSTDTPVPKPVLRIGEDDQFSFEGMTGMIYVRRNGRCKMHVHENGKVERCGCSNDKRKNGTDIYKPAALSILRARNIDIQVRFPLSTATLTHATIFKSSGEFVAFFSGEDAAVLAAEKNPVHVEAVQLRFLSDREASIAQVDDDCADAFLERIKKSPGSKK